jgi:hypothetical protein
MINAELEVLRTLPLLARLADNFDWPTGESSDDPLGFIVPNRSDDLNKSLHLFLLFIHIGDEKLFPDTSAYVCRASGRVGNVKRLPHSCWPLDIAFLARDLARDRYNDTWRWQFGLFTATDSVRPPWIANQNRGGRGTKESLLCAVRLLGHLAWHDDDGTFTKGQAIRRSNILIDVWSVQKVMASSNVEKTI